MLLETRYGFCSYGDTYKYFEYWEIQQNKYVAPVMSACMKKALIWIINSVT